MDKLLPTQKITKKTDKKKVKRKLLKEKRAKAHKNTPKHKTK